MDIIETGDNSHGIVGVSFAQDQTILAYPDKTKGNIRIKNYEKNSVFGIPAHENNIAYIAVSFDGNLIATASEQGTLIRIFTSETGEKLQEVRRGKDKADIKHICFSPDYKFLAASSNKGTIHIWSLSQTLKKLNKSVENQIENKTSGLKWLPGFLGGEFFNSEWSFAQVRITDHRSICCFGGENSVIIVTTNGKYYALVQKNDKISYKQKAKKVEPKHLKFNKAKPFKIAPILCSLTPNQILSPSKLFEFISPSSEI